jgi:methylglutaconyl-CoA hydratase
VSSSPDVSAVNGSVVTNIDARGVATVTLNRPDKHNAFDGSMIGALTESLTMLDGDPGVRVVLLTGAGSSFCAGADLSAMRSIAQASESDNVRDALRLGELLGTLSGLSKPTVARVNGNAFGGGVGLVACCDIVLANIDARLALTEVRFGIVPAMISPYVVAAIGPRQARRYMLTGESISAEAAQRIGLVHEFASAEALDASVNRVIESLLKGGPEAQREVKELIGEVRNLATFDERARHATAQRLARLRASAEGQEGLSAFLEKRAARWTR